MAIISDLNFEDWIVTAICLASFSLIVMLCLGYYHHHDKIERIRSITTGIRKRKPRTKKQKSDNGGMIALTDLARILRNSFKEYFKPFTEGKVSQYRILFERAGWNPLNAAPLYIAMKFILAFISAIFSYILVESLSALSGSEVLLKVLLIIGGTLVGWCLFNVIIGLQISAREKIIAKDFANGMELLIICTNAGLSIDRSFEYVSEELAKNNIELCKEFIITATELRILPDRTAAFRNMANRINLPIMKALSTTLIQSDEQGTSINNTLKNLVIESHMIKMGEIEKRAAKLPTILSVPITLCTLPSLFIMILGPTIIRLIETVKFND